MRSLSRPDVRVPTLDDHGIAGRRRLSHRAEYDADGSIPKAFEDYWNNADVRGLLHAMQAHVCAYCGLEDRTLDVEHFRPKGAVQGDDNSRGYWWLAYEASNYFLGCPACNQKRKGTKFPLAGAAHRVTYDTRHLLPVEERVLIDPVEDHPVERWFHLEWSDPTCTLLPAPELDENQRRRVTEVIDLFNLNMDATVRKRRSKAYEEAVRAANENRWGDVQRMAMRHHEHSFVARFVILSLNQSLPSGDEEAADITASLWGTCASKLGAFST